MIKQPAKVISESDSSYLLETLAKSACPKCAAGEGCGGGILATAFANKTYRLSVKKSKQLQVNDLVQVGIESSVLIRASMVLYLLPLLFMVISAVLAGSLISNHDLYTVTGAIIGMLTGAFTAKLLSRRYLNEQLSTAVLLDEENCWHQAK